MSGVLIAAPSSGSGKTTVTLGLLRALRNRGVSIRPGKAGPDYIDPAFHRIASGRECLNFDPWAMREGLLRRQAELQGPLIIEGMMGLYDAAADGTGSPASLARLLGLSVILVVDCGRMSQSVGAMVRGYATHDPDTRIAGLILNRVGSDRHERMLLAGLEGLDIPVLGILRSDKRLALPERHLGLVQAGEIAGIDAFMEHAAQGIEASVRVDEILSLAERQAGRGGSPLSRIRPLGQHIAIAHDQAFAFSYPHLLAGWREQGAEISFFSPLADEAPIKEADAIYLPGGYPELHAGRLAEARQFRQSMRKHAALGHVVYGECGGYMVLGQALIDANGTSHQMLDLLPLLTSYQNRKRHLGYRRVTALTGPYAGQTLKAHEFHYSTVEHEGQAERLYQVTDAEGNDLGEVGLCQGSVSGSYIHLIDLAGD